MDRLKNFKTFIEILVFISSAALVFSSCEKETDLKIGRTPYVDSIPYYSSMSDVLLAIENIDTQNNPSFPNNNQFVSFGNLSDYIISSIYDTADLEHFDANSARNIVNTYYQYIELVEDSLGEFTIQPKLYECVFRDVINKDRLIRVGDTIYKLFEDGFAFCEYRKLNNLVTISDAQYDSFNVCDSLNGIYIKKYTRGENGLGNKLEYSKVQDKEKVRTIIEFNDVPFVFNYTNYLLNVTTKSFHKWVIWWPCKRDLSHNFTMGIYVNGVYHSESLNRSATNKRKIISMGNNYLIQNTGTNSNILSYISSVDGTISSGSVTLGVSD